MTCSNFTLSELIDMRTTRTGLITEPIEGLPDPTFCNILKHNLLIFFRKVLSDETTKVIQTDKYTKLFIPMKALTETLNASMALIGIIGYENCNEALSCKDIIRSQLGNAEYAKVKEMVYGILDNEGYHIDGAFRVDSGICINLCKL